MKYKLCRPSHFFKMARILYCQLYKDNDIYSILVYVCSLVIIDIIPVNLVNIDSLEYDI